MLYVKIYRYIYLFVKGYLSPTSFAEEKLPLTIISLAESFTILSLYVLFDVYNRPLFFIISAIIFVFNWYFLPNKVELVGGDIARKEVRKNPLVVFIVMLITLQLISLPFILMYLKYY